MKINTYELKHEPVGQGEKYEIDNKSLLVPFGEHIIYDLNNVNKSYNFDMVLVNDEIEDIVGMIKASRIIHLEYGELNGFFYIETMDVAWVKDLPDYKAVSYKLDGYYLGRRPYLKLSYFQDYQKTDFALAEPIQVSLTQDFAEHITLDWDYKKTTGVTNGYILIWRNPTDQILFKARSDIFINGLTKYYNGTKRIYDTPSNLDGSLRIDNNVMQVVVPKLDYSSIFKLYTPASEEILSITDNINGIESEDVEIKVDGFRPRITANHTTIEIPLNQNYVEIIENPTDIEFQGTNYIAASRAQLAYGAQTRATQDPMTTIRDGNITKLSYDEKLTLNQRGVETDLTGIYAWSTNSSHTLARDTTFSHSGSASARLLSNYAGSQTISIQLGSSTTGTRFPVLANYRVDMESWVRVSSAKSVQLKINFYNSSNALVSSSTSSSNSLTGSTWTHIQHNATVPGTAVTAYMEIIGNTFSSGDYMWYDDAKCGFYIPDIMSPTTKIHQYSPGFMHWSYGDTRTLNTFTDSKLEHPLFAITKNTRRNYIGSTKKMPIISNASSWTQTGTWISNTDGSMYEMSQNWASTTNGAAYITLGISSGGSYDAYLLVNNPDWIINSTFDFYVNNANQGTVTLTGDTDTKYGRYAYVGNILLLSNLLSDEMSNPTGYERWIPTYCTLSLPGNTTIGGETYSQLQINSNF